MFRVKEYRDALISAVNDLRDNYFDPQMINEHIDIYKDIVIQYLQKEPDSLYWSSSQELFEYYSDSINAEIEENYQYFLYSLNLPWPFFAWLPEKTPDGRLYIGWGNSYDLDLEDITYKCIIADDTAFQNVLFEQDGIRIPGVYCDLQLSPGRYYLRVVATNESGYSQDCFDYYTESGYGKRYGCMAFEVLDDGTFKQIANAE